MLLWWKLHIRNNAKCRKQETKALEMAAKAGNTEAVENYKKTIEKFKGRK